MTKPFAALLPLFVVIAGCSGMPGNGALIDAPRETEEFSRVAIEDGLPATISTGAKSVVLHMDENLVPEIETVVLDHTLYVRARPLNGVSPSANAMVRVSGLALRVVSASGGSEVLANITDTSEPRFEASGGSTLFVGKLAAARVEVVGSGGSTLRVDGAATSLVGHLSGGSHLESVAPTEDVELVVEGGGEARVEASRRISGDVSGGSKVYVTGSPTERALTTRGGSAVTYAPSGA